MPSGDGRPCVKVGPKACRRLCRQFSYRLPGLKCRPCRSTLGWRPLLAPSSSGRAAVAIFRLARRQRRVAEPTPCREALAAILAAAHDVDARLRRLLLAHERIEKLAATKRGDSGLLAAGGLAIEKPLITLKMVMSHCDVTDRAVNELSGLLVEVSGRQRYRAWKLG